MPFMRSRTRPPLTLVLALLACLTPVESRVSPPGATGQPGGPAQDPAVPVAGLAGVFAPGGILKDRNGDDRVDDLELSLVLPNQPAPEDVAAAVALAARFGLESSGLSFPLAFRAADVELDDGVPKIIIGGGNELLGPDLRQRLTDLQEGHGLVTEWNGHIVAAGRDAAGTQAAAEAFAARSPYLWEVIGRDQGETFTRIASDVTAFLVDGGVDVASVSFDELVYGQSAREVARATITATVGNASGARGLLADLAARHLQGRDTDRLSYSGVADLSLRLVDERTTEELVLPRNGIPQRLLTPPRRKPTRFETAAPSATPGSPAPRRTGRQFDLSEIFATGAGLFEDDDDDRIPENVDTMIVFPAVTPDEELASGIGVTQLAARLGLESTGLSFPLFGFDRELEQPDEETRPLVLVGRHNRWIDELDRLGKLRGDPLGSGVGRIEAVPDAFGGNSALVVTGGDAAGEEAAADHLSRRLPYVWDTGKGQTSLGDARESVRKLLEGRTTAAQAALAVEELEDILDQVEDLDLERLEVKAYFEEASAEFDEWATGEITERVHAAALRVSSQKRLDPVEVFTEAPELTWEVDAFRQRFREQVIPQIAPGNRVSVELRVSEAPELRLDLANEIRSAIEAEGGVPESVVVLSAYKQGLSWLMDQIVPQLRTLPVATVTIGWKPAAVDTSLDWRFFNEPTRWLNELYPADDVLAKELRLPLDAFTFAAEETGSDTYSLTARDAAGRVLLEDGFSPAVYQRPYLEAFPDTKVDVTTGWIRATVDGASLVDERLPTDLDRIWDHYQHSTLAQVHDHVKSTTGGKPTSDKAPFFHTLRVEVQASEPDFKLGIDEEHVSSLESLHDSVYFDTMDFFYEVVESAADNDAVAPRSLAAGNILPWIHPERRGQAPSVSMSYAGFASKESKLVVTYQESGEDEQTITRSLSPETVPRPYVYLVEVDADGDALSQLGLVIRLDTTEPLRRLSTLVDNLTRLHESGLFEEALGFQGVEQVAVRLEAPGAIRTRTYRTEPRANDAPTPAAHPGGQLVTWDHVISPEESEQIAHTLGTTPNVTTYVAGHSYQGRPVSVMEITLPMQADLISQAKMSAWKPVLSIVGRQHANEVSSTSHILRLAELLATDPSYEAFLRKMNVVVQPVVNPDGAALALELQKLTPTHCLHAGRYSALGPDVPGQSSNPDTLITEALVLREINDMWVPDVRLNPHGYPSHEWVQHFANYNPKSFRSYWIPRGWYTSARAPEHPQLEAYRAVALEMQTRIAAEVSRDPEVRATNARIYDRYDRWAIRWQPHVYRLEIQNGTAIYASRRSGTVRRPTGRPSTLAFSGSTEAMDETAHGPWLDLVTRMGFGYLMAAVNFLDQAEYELYRLEEERQGRVYLAVLRPRPVRPGGTLGDR